MLLFLYLSVITVMETRNGSTFSMIANDENRRRICRRLSVRRLEVRR